jgi:hypothetical protein
VGCVGQFGSCRVGAVTYVFPDRNGAAEYRSESGFANRLCTAVCAGERTFTGSLQLFHAIFALEPRQMCYNMCTQVRNPVGGRQ